ncbi:Protein of unknown function [Pyronema omphalodes CBS 100304]|uniref:Uncharacterized protein n=1 Tax=Pyronema omphalodes (strain CBS 100304) TaxID=1076935 RepID=U4LU22_PYROM|nr:Protein of unknown function [Pyronema omphalodes CBS 100304]
MTTNITFLSDGSIRFGNGVPEGPITTPMIVIPGPPVQPDAPPPAPAPLAVVFGPTLDQEKSKHPYQIFISHQQGQAAAPALALPAPQSEPVKEPEPAPAPAVEAAPALAPAPVAVQASAKDPSMVAQFWYFG